VRTVLGESVFHVYAPYDLPDVLGRFLARVKPALYISMETELWPNCLAACAARGIPRLLINGRLSEKSARGYARFSALTTPMLRNLSAAAIQQGEDAQRFVALGLPSACAEITGNIKFDLTLSDDLRARAAELKLQLSEQGQRLIWIAASTHKGEDEILLDAFARLRSLNSPAANNLLLVLVPRHPERFERVAQLCEQRGFAVARRAQGDITQGKDILLGNTIGELMLLFGASDIAFMGGSLVPNGGHNFIEPAAWQLPLLSGEHLFNFSAVARLLREAGALQIAQTADQLAEQLWILLNDTRVCATAGAAAAHVAHENRGALDKTIAFIYRYV
jgi:3-deoxy-D-manno-octulosonic-acid transferase